ncbi:TetR/AcrR family transcriptional regulator [Geodermatophilus nigrescens]|uniref:Transcriptional regulator, TetR family n=1 Tax=Geodermatophilus nigrescens TaxID=1070870 RepID=A0A1M5HZH4_9ACTN|nr:TetR/AcrR family transcriptional regulator [Geodermatophilus nigrescens]SHG21401.1 transcriptional regulator, TetR family [Geodermatophilus nigrescens]
MSSAPEGRPNARRDLVEAQILEQATRLFAERGFAATSLQDIAEATGLTRPALYHYVRNKDDLLSRLVQELTEGPAEELHRINADADRPPLERLRDMAHAVALRMARSPERFRLLIRSEAELPESLADVYARGRRRVLREFTAVIEDGIAAGRLRPVDARVAALGVIGMCNWVAWWHRPGQQDEAVAGQIADMAVASLAEADSRAGEGEGPARALSLLRQDLDYLERLLGG